VATPDADYYRLRTEWLRFKSQLFDGLTGLPALPAIIEDVRRLVEAHGSADVIYLDLGRSGRHETKLGWATYDGAVKEFAAMLRELRDEGRGVLRAEDIVCLHTVRSDRFLVFMGRPDPELAEAGRRTASVRRDRVVKALELRIAEAAESSPLHSIRIAAGHGRVANDPVIRSERSVHQAVSDAMLMSLVEKEGVDAVRRDELSRMIAQRCIRSVFHPIVRLTDRAYIGHEALTRPVGQVAFESIEELFAFAESSDLVMDFERLCRHTAVKAAKDVPNLGLLFLNASAKAVEDPEWSSGVMDEMLAASGLRPHDVVVEITERTAIVHHDTFQSALRMFKERGYRVAVDDMGAGYASFQSLASIEPDFLKFDVSLVRDIDKSSIKRSLLDSLHQLAEKIHARVIAEGVERAEEREALLGLGIELGQGWLFHKPT
jgi:EAL domain-containing protein (putative c-di-GMP-specific phosphodiesterase class I)/GGDEF domain-containing protein